MLIAVEMKSDRNKVLQQDVLAIFNEHMFCYCHSYTQSSSSLYRANHYAHRGSLTATAGVAVIINKDIDNFFRLFGLKCT